MARNYVQPGHVVTRTAPAAGVTTGVGILQGTEFGVALQTAASGVTFDKALCGVFTLAKTAAQVWAIGDKVYWDAANNRCDNVALAGFRFIGHAVAAAANPTATGQVRLTGTPAMFTDDAGPALASHADAGAVTVTAAELLGGLIVADCAGAGRTYTLPTAALLVAAIPGAAVGDIVRCVVVNGSDAAEVLTLAAGANGAFDVNQTAASRVIPQNASKMVVIRLTNVTPAAETYVVAA